MKLQYRIVANDDGETTYSTWIDVPDIEWMKSAGFTRPDRSHYVRDHTPDNTRGRATDIEWRIV